MTNIHSKKDQELVDELIEDLDEDIQDDIKIQESLKPLVVASRDWTVETMIRQIAQKNIDLNPKFQRRNAWDDGKRSTLIESLIWGVPIPQIVLAEDPSRPRSYIVIDGKQRLLTIAGFMDPQFNYWDKPELKGLTVITDLNGHSAEELMTEAAFGDYYRRLMNADIRCTILSNFPNPDVLYDIFYRINTGSVRLGSQELRQVFHRGWFADYLVEITNLMQPIHQVLGLSEPDVRLADVEIVLRNLSMALFGDKYKGNLKQFLAYSMDSITEQMNQEEIETEYELFNVGISNCALVFDYKEIGRKTTNGKFERRFNRALFEVEVFFFKRLTEASVKRNKTKFLKAFNVLMEDSAFRSSIESTTKSIDNTRIRFQKFQGLVKAVFAKTIDIPF